MVRVAGFEPTASWTRISIEYSFAGKCVHLRGIWPVLSSGFVFWMQVGPMRLFCNGSDNGSIKVAGQRYKDNRKV